MSTSTYTSNGVNITSSVTLQTSSLPQVPDFSTIGTNISSGVSSAASIITNTLTGAANGLGLTVTTPSFVNLPQSQIANSILTQVNAPQWPAGWNGTFLTINTQNTSGLSRGALINTGLTVTNANVAHSCDFKFQFPDLGLNFAVIDPVAAIKKAIAKGKLAAKMAIQMAMTVLNDTFRNAMKSLLAGLGFDATGQFSTAFSISKGTLDNIKEIVNKILRYITLTSLVYNLLKDLQQIINYIESLPAQIKSIVQSCLAKFTNSLNSSLASVSSIASQVTTFNNSLATATAQSSSTTVSANTVSTITPILNSIYSGNTPDPTLISSLSGSISNSISNAPPSHGSQQTQGQSP